MGNKCLSRIAFLRDKLTQMGHPPANRILWEDELKQLLLDHPEQQEKEDWPERPKPFVIRGSAKSRKLPHVHWNRALMKGHKSKRDKGERNDYGRRALPAGYTRGISGFIIPPYLRRAYNRFRSGKHVFGRRFTNNGNPWNSQSSTKQRRINPDVREKFDRDVAEFFKLAPCVPFYEARWRLPDEIFTGAFYKGERGGTI